MASASAAAIASLGRQLDVARVRSDFPILSQRMGDKPLVYLDHAATSQKPRAVLEAMSRYYEHDNANIHRGVYELSARATAAYDAARATVRRFLNAADSSEIVFVRSTTEAINLVAAAYGRTHIRAGDEVLISALEHHSNIVPWQMLCEERHAHLRVIPVTDDGELVLEALPDLLTPRTCIVAIGHISNAIGTINPLREIVGLAHGQGVPVLVDGAQGAPHLPVDVQALGCDFYAFSGHKACGPTGIGVLYARREHLDRMPPYQSGGDMIASVTFERTLYAEPPSKFEAGTPNIAGAIGLGAALDYLEGLGLETIAAYEAELLDHAVRTLAAIPGVRLIGTARQRAGVVSFVLDDVHPHDLGTVLDQEGIAIRTGHHCAQPLMDRFGVPATARASLAFYNTREEVDTLAAAVERARELFR